MGRGSLPNSAKENLDWADIIPRCEKNGVPYAVIEQDGDFMSGPFESLTASRNFLIKAGYWKQGA